MKQENHRERYTLTAIVLHWAMALLMIVLFALGWYMTSLPDDSPNRSQLFQLHKSIGLTMAMLVVIRLVWRIKYAPPPLPTFVKPWTRRLAEATHHLLYLSMFVQPVSGYISSSFSGYTTRFWGIPLPHWGWKAPELNELFTEIHEISSVVLLILVLVHIVGFVAHAYRGEMAILHRMMPTKKSL